MKTGCGLFYSKKTFYFSIDAKNYPVITPGRELIVYFKSPDNLAGKMQSND
ncbi:hypothetical protein NIASO_08265 [Niabella soli DSM 19437]|uniref:Uncharacterized protein n=1 Tax=Niabella soli DSM 19437 TaxID=929713 RepID=W0F7Y7_9BACT|nr:hypothetical protein NIASO_08265 [Niabella soli DSM 19437]